MKDARVMGNNIRLLLENNADKKSAFANALGYSVYDVEKLCDARLFTTEEDVQDIAEFFEIRPEELYICKKPEEYAGSGFLHCMGQFKKPENKDKILNIFDMYCDLEEALNE